jgi:hypothetical protein
MNRLLFLFGLLFTGCLCSTAQSNEELKKLRTYVLEMRPSGIDSSFIKYTSGDNLHYLYPLYQLFDKESRFRYLFSDEGYYNQLSEAASFLGDYSSALEYQLRADTNVVSEVEQRQISKNIQLLKNIKHVDARRYITFMAPHFNVIMLNEAYNKPLHRAFALSLLDALYKRGFRYLAMEMLSNFPDQELGKLTSKTGHYAAEPVAGEMIRTALDIGFKLVAYEDPDAATHTARERDSIQALNLFKIIRQDSSAKIFVYAGYGHIAERTTSPDYIPMAMAFKKISGIDPLTIDQTDMTEESNFRYGKAFYESYLQKFPLTSPSIALNNDEPVNITGSTLYDITVIHPPTVYRDSRPEWLTLDGRRQMVYVKPVNKDVFLIQAYYQFESFGSKPGQVVPADQTYLQTAKGNYLLFLRRGKYIVMFRDMQYRVLYTQHVEVN